MDAGPDAKAAGVPGVKRRYAEVDALREGDQPKVPPADRRAKEVPSLPAGAIQAKLRRVPSLVERFLHTPSSDKVVFVMVGLPARGKSFISMRLARFLEWTGIETRVFNAGNHRRKTETIVQDASYFDPHAAAAASRRERIAMEVLTEMLAWLEEGSQRFAVFDATNTTRARRQAVAERLRCVPDLSMIFVESICTDPAVLEANLTRKLAKSPDYAQMPPEEAKRDLLQRINNYEQVYQTIDEDELVEGGETVSISFIKLINFSSHVTAHNIWGRAAVTVLPYLMALHVGSRPVWLVRLPHAEITAHAWRKENNMWPPPSDIRFAEEPPSERGETFIRALESFTQREAPNVAVFTCTHRRGLDVAARFKSSRIRTALNPQDRGAYDGVASSRLPELLPKVWADPWGKRFPGGDSLRDMVQKLMPTLTEVEQEMRPVLIVAPLSALQVLYCYYAGRPIAEALKVRVPQHVVVEFRPSGGNFAERRLLQQDLAC